MEQFLQSEKNVQKCELYHLLDEYLKVRMNLVKLDQSFEDGIVEIERLKSEVWVFTEKKISGEGLCKDNKKLVASHSYKQVEFKSSAAEELEIKFKQVKKLLIEEQSVASYKAEVIRLKIENYIYRMLEENGKESLKLGASVLFSFRRRFVEDPKLSSDLQNWLDQLVSLLLRDATLGCHLFILNHVMRSPAGVGEWGAKYVQPRAPDAYLDKDKVSMNNPLLDHLLTVLSTVLIPVKDRAEFLKDFRVILQSKNDDDIWSLLDTEGEEEQDPTTSWSLMKENDLICILRQIPIDDMFRYI